MFTGVFGVRQEDVKDVTEIIRAVSFALIFVPFMSIIRGFFQGHEAMEPTAISQVIEQIVRIVFLLAGVYVVLNVLDGELVRAIQIATFAATVGAVGGLVVLFGIGKTKTPFGQLDEERPGDDGHFPEGDL